MSDTATTDRTPTPGDVAAKRAGEQVSVTGAQSLVLALEAQGVETVFGLPGGAILPAYDPLLDSVSVRHILVRHEQGAGHAAQGYAAATGKVGAEVAPERAAELAANCCLNALAAIVPQGWAQVQTWIEAQPYAAQVLEQLAFQPQELVLVPVLLVPHLLLRSQSKQHLQSHHHLD